MKTYSRRLGGKRRAGVPGYGVRGPGVRGPRVWKTRGLVENTGCGKRGFLWKTRGLVENTGSSGKHGVSVENTGSECKTQRNHYFAQQLSVNFVMSNCNENQSA